MRKITILILLLTAFNFSFGQNKEDYYIPKLSKKNSNFKNQIEFKMIGTY